MGDFEQILRRLVQAGPWRNQSAMARALGVQPPTIAMWRKVGAVPPRHVGALAAATGIPAHEIRPDLFPAPPPEAA